MRFLQSGKSQNVPLAERGDKPLLIHQTRQGCEDVAVALDVGVMIRRSAEPIP